MTAIVLDTYNLVKRLMNKAFVEDQAVETVSVNREIRAADLDKLATKMILELNWLQN